MSDEKEKLEEILKADPLSELSRKERKTLLLVSMIAIAISKAGLAPTKIVGFGIELSNIDRRAILWLIFLTVLYFWVAFLYNALPDFYSWRVRYTKFWYDSAKEYAKMEEKYGPGFDEPTGPQPVPSAEYTKVWERYRQSQVKFKNVVLTKIALDMAIPTVVGIAAMFFIVAAVW